MHHLERDLIPAPKVLRLPGGEYDWDQLVEEEVIDPTLEPEVYGLLVRAGKIQLVASGNRGLHLARQTLRQIQLCTGKTCPALMIEDQPDFGVRGYMLDISRCKVPKMEQLFRLVDLLSLFKYNQLQLYTEHTFAYEGHEKVWRKASPMSPDDISELRDYCAERFIELVPNQNAFGHMERWLKHPEYESIAECPDGFMHPISGWRSTGSVLYPGNESIDFINGLLEQLLPCFHSDWIHLGCDEPWELGQGKSFDRVEQFGRHEVYREHVCRLADLAAKHGKRMLFWSDELRDDPARITEFPESAIPVAWGYEADHPFDPECEAFATAGRDFLVAPGDSSWNSFSGRLDTCGPNLEKAARAAKDHGAMGLLLTSWGDMGHQQVWPTRLAGLVGFSSITWNQGEIQPGMIEHALNRFIFIDESGAMGKFWVDFGRMDSHIGFQLKPENSSFPYDALYAPVSRLRQALRKQSADLFFPAFSWLDSCEKELARAKLGSADRTWLLTESQLAVEMTRVGLLKAEAALKNEDHLTAFKNWDSILQTFQAAWRHRNREGGLAESLERLRSTVNNNHLSK